MLKQMSRLTAPALAVLIALAFIVAAPASGAADPKARYGDTMVIGITGDPGTLNGTTSSNFVEKIIASNVFSMLIRLDRNFKPVPDLAKSWTISDDGLTYTFKLNEGVKWHDGTPFSSADVKYTIDEVILPLHTRAGTYKSVIDKVEAPDANTRDHPAEAAVRPADECARLRLPDPAEASVRGHRHQDESVQRQARGHRSVQVRGMEEGLVRHPREEQGLFRQGHSVPRSPGVPGNPRRRGARAGARIRRHRLPRLSGAAVVLRAAAQDQSRSSSRRSRASKRSPRSRFSRSTSTIRS